MVPWLSIFAFGLLLGWSNFMTPAMKFWLVMLAALTITPAALTCAPL